MAKTPQRHSLLQQGQLHGELRDQFGFALRQLDSEHLDPARWSFASTAESDHDRTENSCHWVLDAIYREDHNPT